VCWFRPGSSSAGRGRGRCRALVGGSRARRRARPVRPSTPSDQRPSVIGLRVQNISPLRTTAISGFTDIARTTSSHAAWRTSQHGRIGVRPSCSNSARTLRATAPLAPAPHRTPPPMPSPPRSVTQQVLGSDRVQGLLAMPGPDADPPRQSWYPSAPSRPPHAPTRSAVSCYPNPACVDATPEAGALVILGSAVSAAPRAGPLGRRRLPHSQAAHPYRAEVTTHASDRLGSARCRSPQSPTPPGKQRRGSGLARLPSRPTQRPNGRAQRRLRSGPDPAIGVVADDRVRSLWTRKTRDWRGGGDRWVPSSFHPWTEPWPPARRTSRPWVRCRSE
jgi:hypothetical protein